MLNAQLLSPDATANRGKNELVARMRTAGNIVDVTGTLPSIADVENVPLHTRARGKDLSTLLEVIGVVIPRTRTYDIHAQLVKDGDVYRFTRMKGTFGDSDLTGKLTVTHGARLHLDLTLATDKLDIIDAAPFIGYNPDIVATKGAEAAAAATGVGPRPAARCRAAHRDDAAVRCRPEMDDPHRALAAGADLERRPDAGAGSRQADPVAAEIRDGARQCILRPAVRHAPAAQPGALRHPPVAHPARTVAGGLGRRGGGHDRHRQAGSS